MSSKQHAPDENQLLHLLRNRDQVLHKRADRAAWKGCFGSMSIMDHAFLVKLEETFQFTRLVLLIDRRMMRCAWERVFACMVHCCQPDTPSVFGDIFRYTQWGVKYHDRHDDWLVKRNLPVMKVWSGR